MGFLFTYQIQDIDPNCDSAVFWLKQQAEFNISNNIGQEKVQEKGLFYREYVRFPIIL